MKQTRLYYHIPHIVLFACLTCFLIAAGCTDAQPEMTVEATDLTITGTDEGPETVWYTMTVTVTNTGSASANDVIAGITLQTPDPTQMARMAHKSVEFGTVPAGESRSETVSILLEAGPVGYADLVTGGEDPVVTTKIEQMEYMRLPL